MVKDDNYYIRKIIDDLSFVVEHTKNISMEEMIDNPLMIEELLNATK